MKRACASARIATASKHTAGVSSNVFQFEFVFRLVRLFAWAHTLSHNNNNNKRKRKKEKKVGPCLVCPLSVSTCLSFRAPRVSACIKYLPHIYIFNKFHNKCLNNSVFEFKVLPIGLTNLNVRKKQITWRSPNKAKCVRVCV